MSTAREPEASAGEVRAARSAGVEEVARVDEDEAISEEQASRILEEYESEGATRPVHGLWRIVAGVLAVGLAVYALYWTQYSVTTQIYRASFLMIVLVLTFLLYPLRRSDRGRVPLYDIGLAILAVVSLGYLMLNYQAALQRITRPTTLEIVLGIVLILLVLEATGRTAGWALSITAAGFLLYAFLGPYMPAPFDHRGYGITRLVGQNYLTLEGIFGVPLDVAATFIVLFTIYGAVLEYSGAGKFFLDWSFAALGKSRSGSGPGRTVTAAGFLLGTVSGSGVATTVTLGSLAWPMLRRAGFNPNVAGGLLSAAGIGATLSPPTLGAAAFLIAEYLDVSYLKVLVYALIPTILYYLSCLLMMEADARRMRTHGVEVETPPLRELTLKYGYHFSSLFVIVILMALGLTAFMAVFLSIVIAFALSFLRPETRMTSLRALAVGAVVAALVLVRELLVFNFDSLSGTGVTGAIRSLALPVAKACFWGMMLTAAVAAALTLLRGRRRGQEAAPEVSTAGVNAEGVGTAGAVATAGREDSRLLEALEAGGKGVLSVASTTATAGIIVSAVTLTGLGLNLSGIIVDLSQGIKILTILFAALAVWVLGLAVPVTASYIIAAVMIVPAMTTVMIEDWMTPDQRLVATAAAHMFIFYYAVLADVSPPTALAPFAAAAITGGNPFRTTMMAWKYCLPAFLVPIMFTLSTEGGTLLLQGDPLRIAWTFITACLAIVALAIALGGWFIREANMLERVLAGVGGLALLYADPRFDAVGLVLLVVVAVVHVLRTRRPATPLPAAAS
ncbi:MAG: TRAP transporter fused permease subunit [Chloroflexota bacterium]|nr:TRAP transporter fused permease subunit [Chloroflexota bacterium]